MCECYYRGNATSYIAAQHSGPWLFEWVFRPVFLVSVLQSMSVMEDYLVKECQDIEFTVVKPPGLLSCPSSGTCNYNCVLLWMLMVGMLVCYDHTCCAGWNVRVPGLSCCKI